MFRQIGAGEIVLVLAVLLLLFGAKKLPELARSLGRSARELKEGMREGQEEVEAEHAPEESEPDSG
ncbi:MAG TPA: twin-arginine translocase TatA/TatE family subunit [Acidimicrobiia bacterium]|nr:twin-arginine translocase TatA/TatE family subunit [Acidimicrobiia bacterium]